MGTNMMAPVICGGCRWGQVGVWACYYKPADPDDLVVNRTAHADFYGTCPAFETGQPKPPPKPSRPEREWAERAAIRARAEAAEARAAQAEAKVERLRALLSTGLEIVDSLSAGYDVWAEQVRAAVEPGAA